VVVAPDRFSGTLSARAAAAAIAAGWSRYAPDDELDLCPLSDGGRGFVDALAASCPGRLVPVVVDGPAGLPTPAEFLLTDPQPVGQIRAVSAYLESAQVCGPDLVDAPTTDPGALSSSGLGTLIAAAIEAGATRIVVGVGDVITHDAGAGLLAGLATGLGVPGAQTLAGVLGGGGNTLRGLRPDALEALIRLRERLSGVEFTAATDSDVVLLGFKGVSALQAEAKGAGPEQAQQLDLALADFARACLEVLDLPQRLVAEPGAGAGGGLGFGLLLLGATREPGAALVADAVGLAARLAGAGMVVTGEGTLDWRSMRGTVLTAVARSAQQAAVPVVSVAGQIQVGRRELLAAGVESGYPVARTAQELSASLADPAGRLAGRAERVARTWSPRR